MSFMGSVISLDRRSSANSGPISLIRYRLSGRCRLDLRTTCGRRLLLLQLLVFPSIPLILLTSLTAWKLTETAVYARKLARFDDAITEQQHRELAVTALNDELLDTVNVMTDAEDDGDERLRDRYRITDAYHIHDERIADEISRLRATVADLLTNRTVCNCTKNRNATSRRAVCHDVVSGYLSFLTQLSGTEKQSVTGGLPHEIYSHWYAARSLIRIRLNFVENCALGALALGCGDTSGLDNLDYVETFDTAYYHIVDITILDRHLALIFNDTARSDLDRLSSYNYAIGNGLVTNFSAKALTEWNRVCTRFEEVVFPAMNLEIYGGLKTEGIRPAADEAWSMLGFHVFCLLIQLPVLLFIVQNGRNTSVSIFSSVNMFSSRVSEIKKEKYKTEQLLKEMLPKTIARQLLTGRRSGANFYDRVTVSFSDITDFADVSRTSKPVEIVTFLNEVYNFMDSKIECYDVYKVETIGSVYMVASGLPISNGDRHVTEVASMAIDLIRSSKSFNVSHLPGYRLQLRFGIHTGSCCAGVVGNKMPRYCLFGDTVNTASRMQSSCEGNNWVKAG
ncbi:hypothetical protein LSH36_76g05005 [Paralvinella palmiformis]|uniref:Guanylate cyclase domain-containing protein n=1 Tax=Paralvinella palmiformis TaxID=53620 RepID=A0AAD9K2E9_9ANNE|nr:hypothetical protein LSH36_76g05005 [Paralvinella palmiformis]